MMNYVLGMMMRTDVNNLHVLRVKVNQFLREVRPGDDFKYSSKLSPFKEGLTCLLSYGEQSMSHWMRIL
jgi:hypothetical protein